MSFTNFTSNENKSIIWGLLQEGGVFNDIPNSYFENIKRHFEMSILSMKPEFDIFFDKNDEGDEDYNKKASEMIVNSNKTVIKKMINELGKFKKPQQRSQQQPTHQQQAHQQLAHQQPSSQLQPLLSSALPIPPRFDMTPESSKTIDARGGGKKQKIEEIYRADDLQKHRMSELEIRLKEKQEEMDIMLNNKKPTAINFSDSSTNDNKLASDEMDKLLADALSSRQRELEQLVPNKSKDNSKNAEEWITGSNDPVTNALNASIAIKRSHDIKRPTEQTSTMSKKNVSFNEKNNEEILYDKDSTSYASNVSESTAISDDTTNNGNLSFLSKLKRTNTKSIEDDVLGMSNISDGNIIPLDEFMTGYNDDDNDDDNLQKSIHLFSHDTTRDAIDSREYVKLDEKINKIQNYIESIKQTQDKILELLSPQ
jgi:hypothetical protein